MTDGTPEWTYEENEDEWIPEESESEKEKEKEKEK